MKTKLLKQIRKRYKYYFKADGNLVTIDLRKQKVVEYAKITTFIISYVYDFIGFMVGTEYHKKLWRREDKREVRKAMEEYQKNAPRVKFSKEMLKPFNFNHVDRVDHPHQSYITYKGKSNPKGTLTRKSGI